MGSAFLETLKSQLDVALSKPGLRFEQGCWMRNLQKGAFWPAGISPLTSENFSCSHGSNNMMQKFSTGTSAAQEETAHDTGTEYSLGAVKFISSLCMQ